MWVCVFMWNPASRVWEEAEEEDERFEVADRAVCHSAPSSLQKHASLRAIFHPWGIPLVLAVVWLTFVVAQLHFTSWRGDFPEQTNNQAATLPLNVIMSCGASQASFALHFHVLFTNTAVKWIQICTQNMKAFTLLFLELFEAQARSWQR